MPILDSGFGDTQRLLVSLMQINEERKRRESGEATRLAETAKPGQTAKDAGINEKLWKRLYGKDTPYNPNLILLQETADHRINNEAIRYINSLQPAQLLDLGATATNYRLGLPGATTAAGSIAQRETGGRQAEITNEVSKGTKDVQIKGGIAKATTDTNTALTQQATSADIYQRVLKGIESMSRAPAEVQQVINEKAAYGVTADEATQNQMKTQLGISSLKQALIAQRNPNHPMNKFLQNNGLNMETVLAATSMGLGNMLDDYVRSLHTSKAQGREASNIMLRMQTEYASKIAKDVLGGKVTPRQVLAVMEATESGKPVPKGLEGVKALWDNTVDIFYRATVNEALQKGDPYLQGLAAQLNNAGKLKDPTELNAFNDLARTGSAYAATLLEVGRQPQTPDEVVMFNQLMEQHKNRIAGVKSANPWYWFPSHTPIGPGSMQNLPPQVQQMMSPGESTNMKGSIVPPAAAPGQAPPALPFSPAPAAAGGTGLSNEDAAAIQMYLKSLGLGQ